MSYPQRTQNHKFVKFWKITIFSKMQFVILGALWVPKYFFSKKIEKFVKFKTRFIPVVISYDSRQKHAYKTRPKIGNA